MRPESRIVSAEDHIAELSARHANAPAERILDFVLADKSLGPVAMVSSFGAESVALLHMVASIAPTTPVLFLDTEMLFPETLAYQRELTESLGLSDVRILRPDRVALFEAAPEGDLHRRDPDACCNLRKAQPLEAALDGFAGWITGRKRFQGGTRTGLPVYEMDAAGRIKVNPLAHWSSAEVSGYIGRHRLPRHPLVSRGFPSIGCMPCTSRVEPGEDIRSGRWRGIEKQECGIHIVDGRIQRAS